MFKNLENLKLDVTPDFESDSFSLFFKNHIRKTLFDEDTIEIRAKLNLIMDKGPFEITWDGWELMRTINTDINNAKY